jgi:hypothetical protein
MFWKISSSENENSCKHFDTFCKKIVWCYALWHPNLSLKDVTFQQGIEGLDELESGDPVLIIFGDYLMQEVDASIVSLCTRGCHHQNRSVILITQNMFHQKKGQRDIA